MKIKLLRDIPVDPKHDLTKDKVLEVLRIRGRDREINKVDGGLMEKRI